MERSIHDNNYEFLREKVYRLHTAIMYSMSNELIKIPNSIVNVLRIDNEGHLWFQCKAPLLHIKHYEQHFPARLHFFRKGFKYFVELSGSTVITSREYDDKNGTLILRMNINHIEYTEPQARKRTWLDQLMEESYGWMLRTLAIPRTTKSFFAKLQHHNR